MKKSQIPKKGFYTEKLEGYIDRVIYSTGEPDGNKWIEMEKRTLGYLKPGWSTLLWWCMTDIDLSTFTKNNPCKYKL